MAIFFLVWGWEKELYGHGLLNKKWASLHSKLKYVFISKTSQGKDPDTRPKHLDKIVPSCPFNLYIFIFIFFTSKNINLEFFGWQAFPYKAHSLYCCYLPWSMDGRRWSISQWWWQQSDILILTGEQMPIISITSQLHNGSFSVSVIHLVWEWGQQKPHFL